MFIIDTSLQSDHLKWVELAKSFYFHTQVSGRQDKLAWTACPHPSNLALETK